MSWEKDDLIKIEALKSEDEFPSDDNEDKGSLKRHRQEFKKDKSLIIVPTHSKREITKLKSKGKLYVIYGFRKSR